MLDEVLRPPPPQMKQRERDRQREREREGGKKLRWLEAEIRQIWQIPKVPCNKDGEWEREGAEKSANKKKIKSGVFIFNVYCVFR
jgi:hypothetical protein